MLDAPASALDRSVQSDIVAMLQRLRHVHGLICQFISHDLAVAQAMSNVLIVMEEGRIVEADAIAAKCAAAQQAFARELIAALPAPRQRRVCCAGIFQKAPLCTANPQVRLTQGRMIA